MTASAYCTAAQLHEHGLPRGALPNPGRLLAVVYPATDTLELDEHGFPADAPLLFRAEEGGELPTGIDAGTTYYAIPLTDATFQVSLTEGGSAVDIMTEGSSVVVTAALPKQAAIEWASALVDDYLPAHAVPLEAPFPVTVVAITAELAIAKLAASAGQASASLGAVMERAQKQLERWGKGLPIRGAIVPTASNLSVVRSAATGNPWVPTGGTIP